MSLGACIEKLGRDWNSLPSFSPILVLPLPSAPWHLVQLFSQFSLASPAWAKAATSSAAVRTNAFLVIVFMVSFGFCFSILSCPYRLAVPLLLTAAARLQARYTMRINSDGRTGSTFLAQRCALIVRIENGNFCIAPRLRKFERPQGFGYNTHVVTENHGLPLIRPRVTPMLDAEFRPAVLAAHACTAGAEATRNPSPVRLALEQADGSIYHFNAAIFPERGPQFRGSFQVLDFELWKSDLLHRQCHWMTHQVGSHRNNCSHRAAGSSRRCRGKW